MHKQATYVGSCIHNASSMLNQCLDILIAFSLHTGPEQRATFCGNTED